MSGAELASRIERILFGEIEPSDRRAHNKRADVDHLVGHALAGRDVFVTGDKDILRKRDALQSELGIVVETRDELLQRFD